MGGNFKCPRILIKKLRKYVQSRSRGAGRAIAQQILANPFPYSNQEGRLCRQHYNCPSQIFERCIVSVTAFQPTHLNEIKLWWRHEISFLQQNNNGKPGEMLLLKNGVIMSQALQGALFTYGKGGTIETIFGTAILELQAGDKVSILIA